MFLQVCYESNSLNVNDPKGQEPPEKESLGEEGGQFYV